MPIDRYSMTKFDVPMPCPYISAHFLFSKNVCTCPWLTFALFSRFWVVQ